jgi:hypothetical protein
MKLKKFFLFLCFPCLSWNEMSLEASAWNIAPRDMNTIFMNSCEFGGGSRVWVARLSSIIKDATQVANAK